MRDVLAAGARDLDRMDTREVFDEIQTGLEWRVNVYRFDIVSHGEAIAATNKLVTTIGYPSNRSDRTHGNAFGSPRRFSWPFDTRAVRYTPCHRVYWKYFSSIGIPENWSTRMNNVRQENAYLRCACSAIGKNRFGRIHFCRVAVRCRWPATVTPNNVPFPVVRVINNNNSSPSVNREIYSYVLRTKRKRTSAIFFSYKF